MSAGRSFARAGPGMVERDDGFVPKSLVDDRG
jgi:hypothetical protein